MKIETASVDAVILYFEEIISEEVLDQVQDAYRALQGMAGIIALTPSYHSVLVRYDLFTYSDMTVKRAISKRVKTFQSASGERKGKMIEIPVDYTKGIDLERVAHYNNLTMDQVISLHTQQTYRIYAIGFMVGFAYLASIDTQIATPRLETPRSKVPKGSVAIADRQTAVYPQESAGGWNILGHTDFDDFDRFEIGDQVRFLRV